MYEKICTFDCYYRPLARIEAKGTDFLVFQIFYDSSYCNSTQVVHLQ